MITTDTTARSNRYRILESAISFTENYQNTNLKGNPIYDVVYVSVVSNANIMVYDANNGIDYGADLQYKRWRLNGATTGLVSSEAHNIYAKLSKSDSNAAGDVVFSTYNYTTQGVSEEKDEEGNPLKDYSDTHWMIKIGTLTALTNPGSNTPDRVLTFDPGQLGTQKDNNEKGAGLLAKMFDLVMDDPERIKPLLWFNDLKVRFESIFDSIVNFYSGIRIGVEENAREISSVAVASDAPASEDDDKAIATPAYVKAFSEARYLRYDITEPQSVAGVVTFKKRLEADATLKITGNTEEGETAFVVGDYIEEGDMIQGAAITKDGIASFARVKTPSMQVYELVYNRKTAVQGEFVFSDGDTIESITYVCDNGVEYTHEQVEEGIWAPYSEDRKTQKFRYIRAKVRAPYEGYTTTMKEYDILYSNINNIGASGESATTGKCFLRILADDEIPGVKGVEDDGVTLNVMHYLDEYTPSRFNMLPTPHMTITRHGNTNNKDRQDMFLISSEDGRVAQLVGIDAPIVSVDTAYAVVMGRAPYSIYEKIHDKFSYYKESDPVVYAKYGIFENILQYDYDGRVIKRDAYRGIWSEAVAKGLIEGEERYRCTDTIADTVTHEGSLWRCNINTTTQPPQGASAEWTMVIAKGDDSAVASYEILPSTTAIYLRQNNDMSVTHINVEVGETTAHGYVRINDQMLLDERSLTVLYSIDGGAKIAFSISDAAALALEDGTGLIATETGGGLWLEGDEIDASQIKDNITLYLVKDYGLPTEVEMSLRVIPVTKDGENGKDGLTPNGNFIENSNFDLYNADKTTLKSWLAQRGTVERNAHAGHNVFVSTTPVAEEEGGDEDQNFLSCDVNCLQSEGEFTFSFNTFRPDDSLCNMHILYVAGEGGGGINDTTEYISVDAMEASGVYLDFESAEGDTSLMNIRTPRNEWAKVEILVKVKQPSTNNIRLYFTGGSGIKISQPKLEYGNTATPYEKAQADLTGPAGKQGRMLYPAGTWANNKYYQIENNSAPFVYHDGTYYVLEYEDAAVFGDEAKPGIEGDRYWGKFQYFDYIFTEFLMANQARFGSREGGVFANNWLFSALKKSGSQWGGEAIEEDGTFENSDDTPMLAIDFKNGKLHAQNAVIQGEVNATSGIFSGGLSSNYGFVGPMFIGRETMAMVTEDDDGKKNQLVINPFTGLSYRGENPNIKEVTNCSFGIVDGYHNSWVTKPDGTQIAIENAPTSRGFSVKVENNRETPLSEVCAIRASMKGTALKNYAFYCTDGQFAGLRTNTKVITSEFSNRSVDWKDHHVLVVKHGEQNHIYLKIDNKGDGAELVIESRINEVYIQAVDTPVYSHVASSYFLYDGYANIKEGTDDDALVLSKGVWLMKRNNQYTQKGSTGEWSLYPLYKNS